MNKVLRTLLLLVLIWATPVSLWLTPFPADADVRDFVDRHLGTVQNGIGVSAIYMILPTIMAVYLPFPWEMERTFRNAEIYVVILVCIFRASTATVMFQHAAPNSCHWYFASIGSLITFISLKNFQKIKPMDTVVYGISWFNTLVFAVFMVCVEAQPGTILVYMRIILVHLFYMILFGELMYAAHVERTNCCPNSYMVCALLILGGAVLVPLVTQQFSDYMDNESVCSGLLGFAFILYFLGYRTQEKRLLSDVVNRFEEVPRDDDDQLI